MLTTLKTFLDPGTGGTFFQSFPTEVKLADSKVIPTKISKKS